MYSTSGCWTWSTFHLLVGKGIEGDWCCVLSLPSNQSYILLFLCMIISYSSFWRLLDSRGVPVPWRRFVVRQALTGSADRNNDGTPCFGQQQPMVNRFLGFFPSPRLGSMLCVCVLVCVRRFVYYGCVSLPLLLTWWWSWHADEPLEMIVFGFGPFFFACGCVKMVWKEVEIDYFYIFHLCSLIREYVRDCSRKNMSCKMSFVFPDVNTNHFKPKFKRKMIQMLSVFFYSLKKRCNSFDWFGKCFGF